MKITIESTAKIVEMVEHGHAIKARVWQGETDSGIPVQCFVVRVAPEILASDPRIGELTAEFDRDLMRQADVRATVDAIPLRIII